MKIIKLSKDVDSMPSASVKEIFINVNHIESFYRYKGYAGTFLQINRSGNSIEHYVNETPEEIMELIRRAESLV